MNQITFGVSNAAGVVSNLTGYVTAQYFDTNLLAYTTNFFQGYDIPLTNGVNTITISATDLAGNETTTNVSYTLDYSSDHTAPVLSAVWPQPNTLISGTNFNLQAVVDDDTATVIATVTDTNNDTNIVTALVERNGNVWANNLPLSLGTNMITLTATDAAGNVNTTSFPVVQSSVNLTTDPISSDQANQESVNVTGTVSNPSLNVWVNTIQASVDDSGNWEADGVPVSASGMANLNVQAGIDTNNIAGTQMVSQPQPLTLQLSSYFFNSFGTSFGLTANDVYGTTFDDTTINWTLGSGGAIVQSGYVNPPTSEEPIPYLTTTDVGPNFDDIAFWLFYGEWEVANETYKLTTLTGNSSIEL